MAPLNLFVTSYFLNISLPREKLKISLNPSKFSVLKFSMPWYLPLCFEPRLSMLIAAFSGKLSTLVITIFEKPALFEGKNLMLTSFFETFCSDSRACSISLMFATLFL